MLNETIKNNIEGSIRISDDVILVIAAKEISEIKDVVGLYSSTKLNLYKLKLNSKSVRTDIKDKKVNIDIDVTLKYGAVIAETAAIIQDRVTKAVESMTGLTVESVNVFVKSIEISDESSNTDDDE
ncbi:MAG: Asp23/Gls24 family envelope stress response protein [Clostridia bacterium]|nr:Asp23/Gls24 family envelope stress response protein [Clostridia bacterium]